MANYSTLLLLCSAVAVAAGSDLSQNLTKSQLESDSNPIKKTNSTDVSLTIRTRRGASVLCCPTHHNYCGHTLYPICPQFIENDALYSCTSNEAPIRIKTCPGGCKNNGGDSDICSRNETDSGSSKSVSARILLPFQPLWSATSKTKLILQDDGNLVLYRVEANKNIPVWGSGTNVLLGKPTSVQVLSSGDLVMGNAKGKIIWRLGTDGTRFEGAVLRVFDGENGKFCLVESGSSSTCLWSSRTGARKVEVDNVL